MLFILLCAINAVIGTVSTQSTLTNPAGCTYSFVVPAAEGFCSTGEDKQEIITLRQQVRLLEVTLQLTEEKLQRTNVTQQLKLQLLEQLVEERFRNLTSELRELHQETQRCRQDFSVTVCPSGNYTVPVLEDLPQSAFTATSQFSISYAPWTGKFSGSLGWAPISYGNLENEYLQVDLGNLFTIGKTGTLGRAICCEMIKSYKIGYSIDDITWKTYENTNGNDTVFSGNEYRTTVVTHALQVPILAQYVRLYPVSGNPWPTVRWELYTCAK